MKVSEDTVSMFLGLAVVVVVIGLMVNFVQRGKGNISVPGLSSPTEGLASNAEESAEKTGFYKVVSGDSLWKIAEKKLGDGEKWVELAKINDLKNPGIIFSGQELKLPEVKQVENKGGEYVVVKGDYLWKIALNEYGDGFGWTKIWEANRAMIRNPDLIEVGMRLAIPR